MIRSFLRTVLGLFLLFVVLSAGAQVVPVQPTNWLPLGGGAILFALAAFVWWYSKRASSTQQADAKLIGTAALHEAGTLLTDAAHELGAAVAALKAHAAAAKPVPSAPAPAPAATVASGASIPAQSVLKAFALPAAPTASAPIPKDTPMTTAELLAALSALTPEQRAAFGLPAIPAAAPVVQAAPTAAGNYPGYYAVGGAVMLLEAPISPKWVPSINAQVMAGVFTPAHYMGAPGAYSGPFVYDPSNAVGLGVPIRSAAGYPLVYGLMPDPQQMRQWQAGTRQERPDTVVNAAMPPRMAWGGNTYASDAEVDAYITRISQQPTV